MAQKVTLRLAKPADLLERWYPNGKLGGVSIDGPAPAPMGELIDLEIRFVEPTRSFKVATQLAWARHHGARNLRECYGLEFTPQALAARDRLLAFAREEVPQTESRYEERLATDLQVRITHQGIRRREFLMDLSPGGAFIRTALALPVGSELLFEVRPPRSLRRLHLRGHVVWVRQTGNAPGMGVAFEFESTEQADGVQRLLWRLEP